MKTMNKFILACLLTLAGFISINAQTDTYVGAQFARVDTAPTVRYSGQNDYFGVVANRTWYQTKSIGLTGETSANFDTSSNKGSQFYTAMGGVTLKYRGYEKVQPFVSGTAGLGILHLNRQNGTIVSFPSKTDASEAFKASGGVDYGKSRVRWRVFEAGYLRTNFLDSRQNTFTLSTGVLF